MMNIVYKGYSLTEIHMRIVKGMRLKLGSTFCVRKMEVSINALS